MAGVSKKEIFINKTRKNAENEPKKKIY